MKKIIIGLILTIVLLGYWQFSNRIHRQIQPSDVSEIYIWAASQDLGRIQKIVNDQGKNEMIKWFNSLSDIRFIQSIAGETPQSGINISLKNGKKINVLRFAENFEIQRPNSGTQENLSYLASQKNTKEQLEMFLTAPDEQQRALIKTFVNAEYSGDINTLLSITKEEANTRVRNNEITRYQTHKFDLIMFTTVGPNEPGIRKFIVSVQSIVNGKYPERSDEHLTMKKIDDKWYVVKIEYDA